MYELTKWVVIWKGSAGHAKETAKEIVGNGRIDPN